ncbi:MAG: hypothetical protein HY014_03495 [Acidobacteria bacterium]|nr:hypothetical protein [Acidobacteriota bacterium]MBI3487217.1 hypothetical protein [Acidobacteriota bacterium]
MTYEPMNYEYLRGGAIKGFSDSQLELHFTLYKGYLTKLNEIEEKLISANNSKPNYSFNEYSELKRREAVAFNGSFLHELYFENLGADTQTSPELEKAMDAQGGVDKILADLKAAALGGPGWALLTQNRRDGKLHTYFVAEHHLGMPIDQDLLLVLDSWEHAFMVDFGMRRSDYINAFLENIKWSQVSRRFANAKLRHSGEGLHERGIH